MRFLNGEFPSFLMAADGGGGGAGGGAGGADGAGGGGGGGNSGDGGADGGAGKAGDGDNKSGGDKGAGKTGDAAKGAAGADGKKAAAPGDVLGVDPAAAKPAGDKAGEKAGDDDAKKATDAKAKKEADDKKDAEAKAAKKAPKDGYKLDAKALELPEGMEIDEGAKAIFDPIAAELDLPQDAYNKVAKGYAQVRARDLQLHADQVNGWREEAKKDKEIGGAKYDETVADARAALTEYGSERLRHDLFYSGFGNHPELLRFVATVGRALKQGQGVNPNRGGQGAKGMADRIYGNAEK